MSYSDDPVADFDRYDAEQEAWLKELPKCECCDQHIQDSHYYDIEGEYICPDCISEYCDKNFRKYNEFL